MAFGTTPGCFFYLLRRFDVVLFALVFAFYVFDLEARGTHFGFAKGALVPRGQESVAMLTGARHAHKRSRCSFGGGQRTDLPHHLDGFPLQHRVMFIGLVFLFSFSFETTFHNFNFFLSLNNLLGGGQPCLFFV
jgi:hypothetical protein